MFDSILRVIGDKESDWKIDYEPAVERYKAGQEFMKGSDRVGGYQQVMYTRVFYKDGSGDFSSKLDNDKLGLPQENLDEETKVAVQMVEEGYNYFARWLRRSEGSSFDMEASVIQNIHCYLIDFVLIN